MNLTDLSISLQDRALVKTFAALVIADE